MAKIPKNLTDKAMFSGVKEEQTFETMVFGDEPEVAPVKTKVKNKEKEKLSTAYLTQELQEKIGKALLEMKLELYKEGLVEYDIKVAREGQRIILTAAPTKSKTVQA